MVPGAPGFFNMWWLPLVRSALNPARSNALIASLAPIERILDSHHYPTLQIAWKAFDFNSLFRNRFAA